MAFKKAAPEINGQDMRYCEMCHHLVAHRAVPVSADGHALQCPGPENLRRLQEGEELRKRAQLLEEALRDALDGEGDMTTERIARWRMVLEGK